MAYFRPGTWNCVCQVCGVQFKSDQMLKRWDGLLVCKRDFEVRHIADFIRPTPERAGVPFIADEPVDVFVTPPASSCPYPTTTGLADIGTADCAGAGVGAGTSEPSTSAIANIAIAEAAIAAPEPF